MMQNTLAKALLLTLPLALAGCWESEHDCYMRHTKNGSLGSKVTLKLVEIKFNTDLDVCDYTVLGGEVVKID